MPSYMHIMVGLITSLALQVFFGPFECPNAVVTPVTSEVYRITVPLCSFEASLTNVYVLTESGYAVQVLLYISNK